MSSRRDAVPFDPRHFKKLTSRLVHLSFGDIRRAEQRAQVQYPLAPHDDLFRVWVNEEIATGDWPPLDLERDPFEFPAPFELLNERCTEGGGVFADKSLGLWRTADLARLPFLAT